MPTNVINGTPGTRWKNDTGKVAYQFKVARANTCGLCYQFDGAIRAGSWPIPLHFGCKCVQETVYANALAKPFTDFRETIRNLDEDQKAAVVGAYNYRLIESGVVQWSDVVTASRIRDLTEVVALKRLSVRQMTDVGIPRSRAEAVHKAANDARNAPAEESRRRILAALERRGIDAAQARQAAAQKLASRVTARRIEPPQRPDAGPVAPVVPTPVAPAAPPTIAALPMPAPVAPAARYEFLVQDRPKYEAAWREVLGRVPDDADVAALAGAPDGAEIKAKGSEYGSVVVTWTLPGIGTASRTFYPSDSGRPTIQAAYFELDENQRGKGLGAEMFGRTVEAGIRLGFDRIVTHAARSKSHNGYAVWPLFGYDGPLPESTRQRLPESLANARNVSDLMRTEEGRTWWSANGHDINLTFSLRPRSKSLRVWNAYRAAKAAIEATRRTSPGRTGR